MNYEIGAREVPVALHPKFRAMRNKRKRWREIRKLKRMGVRTYLAPYFDAKTTNRPSDVWEEFTAAVVEDMQAQYIPVNALTRPTESRPAR